jgi:hypothetical protein
MRERRRRERESDRESIDRESIQWHDREYLRDTFYHGYTVTTHYLSLSSSASSLSPSVSVSLSFDMRE